MGSFFINYRDPIFSIIVFIAIIFVISFANYCWDVFKKIEKKNKMDKFLRNFETKSDFNDYHVLLNKNLFSIESITLLALAFEKIGDYQKAINLLLFTLKDFKNDTQKHYILFLLSKVYYKAGILHKARDLCLDILREYPRDKQCLNFLINIYEKTQNYKEALEVLDVLDEFGEDIKAQKKYVESLLVLSDEDMSVTKKQEMLLKLSRENKFVLRLFLDFAIKYNLKIDFKRVDYDSLRSSIDLLWEIDKNRLQRYARSVNLIDEILAAKGVNEDVRKSSIFELDLLINLKQLPYNSVILKFKYFCKQCNNAFPIYAYRCPSCQSFGSIEVKSVILEKIKA